MNINKIIVESIRDFLKEAYDDVPLDYILNKEKLWDYKNYDNKKIIGDYTYLNFVESDSQLNFGNFFLWGDIIVFDNKDGTEVAHMSYGKHYKYSPMVGAVDVRPDKRRQGIASEMYKWSEDLTGEKIYPDTPHSKSAEAFWNNPNRKFGYDK